LRLDSFRLEIQLFRLGVLLVFLGRAWQHWFFDAPYRELLWDEGRMQFIIEKIFRIPWSIWVTNTEYDAAIAAFINGVGVFYLVCGLAVLLIYKSPQISKVILWAGAISLFFLSGLYFKSKLYNFGQFIEYSLQFASPVILILLTKENSFNKKIILALKVAIAFTFIGHGLYAVNFHPRPANFLVMCMNILGITESGSIVLLNIAGTLDFLIAVAIFLPFRKVVLVALAYAAFWGFATAIARPWAYFYVDYWLESLHRWLFEGAYRLIHGIGPLVLFLYYWRHQRQGLAPKVSEQDQILA
jgi:hypothetical protein